MTTTPPTPAPAPDHENLRQFLDIAGALAVLAGVAGAAGLAFGWPWAGVVGSVESGAVMLVLSRLLRPDPPDAPTPPEAKE